LGRHLFVPNVGGRGCKRGRWKGGKVEISEKCKKVELIEKVAMIRWAISIIFKASTR
jgi:hypothetical protein